MKRDVNDKDYLLYEAWALIANANEGDWDATTPEWRAAAEQWRDRWLATLLGPSENGDTDG